MSFQPIYRVEHCHKDVLPYTPLVCFHKHFDTHDKATAYMKTLHTLHPRLGPHLRTIVAAKVDDSYYDIGTKLDVE